MLCRPSTTLPFCVDLHGTVLNTMMPRSLFTSDSSLEQAYATRDALFRAHAQQLFANHVSLFVPLAAAGHVNASALLQKSTRQPLPALTRVRRAAGASCEPRDRNLSNDDLATAAPREETSRTTVASRKRVREPRDRRKRSRGKRSRCDASDARSRSKRSWCDARVRKVIFAACDQITRLMGPPA